MTAPVDLDTIARTLPPEMVTALLSLAPLLDAVRRAREVPAKTRRRRPNADAQIPDGTSEAEIERMTRVLTGGRR